MRLTAEERAGVEDYLRTCDDAPHRVRGERTAIDVLETVLARDAERTAPVTPEWLDGPEGRRLGFERDRHDELLWTAKADGLSSANVRLSFPGPALWVADWLGSEAVVDRQLHGDATIAQVRDAVRLFTGRE